MPFLLLLVSLVCANCIYGGIVIEKPCPETKVVRGRQLKERDYFAIVKHLPLSKEDGKMEFNDCSALIVTNYAEGPGVVELATDNYLMEKNVLTILRTYATARYVNFDDMQLKIQFQYPPDLTRDCNSPNPNISMLKMFWDYGPEINWNFIAIKKRFAITYSCHQVNSTHYFHSSFVLARSFADTDMDKYKIEKIYKSLGINLKLLHSVGGYASCFCKRIVNACWGLCKTG